MFLDGPFGIRVGLPLRWWSIPNIGRASGGHHAVFPCAHGRPSRLRARLEGRAVKLHPNSDAVRRLLYFDDLYIDQMFESDRMAIERDLMIAFAERFDPQPFHVGDRIGLAGELAASGWLTASITQRLLIQGGLPLAEGMVGLGVEVRWPNPTRAGDILQALSRIVELRPSRSRSDRGIVTVQTETINQRDHVLQFQLARVLVPRRRSDGTAWLQGDANVNIVEQKIKRSLNKNGTI